MGTILTQDGPPTPAVPVSMLHIRYEGASYDYPLSQFDTGILAGDTEVKQAVATNLNVPVEKLRNYEVDRNTDTGDITLRPNAVFGKLP